ncbi:MAG TPA: hypothetical protein VF510_25685, partial [Ktedonobacterales bacterium]
MPRTPPSRDEPQRDRAREGSRPAHTQQHDGESESAPVDAEQTLPADEEPTEIAQPGEAAFHFVPLPIVFFARHDRASALG